jgi:hypothetical protein
MDKVNMEKNSAEHHHHNIKDETTEFNKAYKYRLHKKWKFDNIFEFEDKKIHQMMIKHPQLPKEMLLFSPKGKFIL